MTKTYSIFSNFDSHNERKLQHDMDSCCEQDKDLYKVHNLSVIYNKLSILTS